NGDIKRDRCHVLREGWRGTEVQEQGKEMNVGRVSGGRRKRKKTESSGRRGRRAEGGGGRGIKTHKK
ncbi:hypothetical protein AKG67_23000, partial [Vibrio parahaemolyticus]